ncbi:MAG TPA: low molecular weight phosphotyrosine protein phosphatase [Alphaproteobacteria bacterium]|nr:low molecular weight phosphotyrosine protein phosphatase [Alphaproteobacteria bacterium]
MGNICRSPSAEGVFRGLVESEGLERTIGVDSAGTHAYHNSEPPDPRSMEAARRRGIDISRQRARRAHPVDFQRFDYVIAMDRENYAHLATVCPPGEEHRLKLFLDFAPELERQDVPDPYFGGSGGFEVVLDLIEAAAKGLLEHIRNNDLPCAAKRKT